MATAAALITTIIVVLISIAIFRYVVQDIAERNGMAEIEIGWRDAFVGWFTFSLASGVAGAAIGWLVKLVLNLL